MFAHDQLEAMCARIGELDDVIANEYFLHEAGQFIGIDVDDKYASGYFRVGGTMLWPLIDAEELRRSRRVRVRPVAVW